jgi:predicted RNA polymerase sigma factor
MQHPELIPHLFRTEYRKIVSVLCKHFGIDQIEIAEDIASDTFLTAAETWSLNHVPENPVAWLYHVAKNKAKNVVRRHTLFEDRIKNELKSGLSAGYETEIDLSPQNIQDSQLQMMFAICHPAISSEAQIGLSLRILCGFGIKEIADAFLSNTETVNKRLFWARFSENGELIIYDDQDTNLWDSGLISQGAFYLHCSASGNTLSKYHLEAAIAYWHTQKTDSQEKWENILQNYNRLLQLEYSPVAALNRTYALSKVMGKQAAITEAEKLKLNENPYYYMLLGVLYSGVDKTTTKQHLITAHSLARTKTDRLAIQKKLIS